MISVAKSMINEGLKLKVLTIDVLDHQTINLFSQLSILLKF